MINLGGNKRVDPAEEYPGRHLQPVQGQQQHNRRDGINPATRKTNWRIFTDNKLRHFLIHDIDKHSLQLFYL